MFTRHGTRLVLGALVAFTGACAQERTEGLPPDVVASLPRDEPIESTGADTRHDLIRRDDPSALDCLVELGRRDGEFYDKVTEALVFPPDTAFFDARFTDGARVEIRVHPELGGPDDARLEAERIASALGRLPSALRPGIERVGILGGDATAMADGGGEGIHLYRENVERRVAANRFEETLFHEAVHTTLDDVHARSPEWLAAQRADGRFLTAYARAFPRAGGSRRDGAVRLRAAAPPGARTARRRRPLEGARAAPDRGDRGDHPEGRTPAARRRRLRRARLSAVLLRQRGPFPVRYASARTAADTIVVLY